MCPMPSDISLETKEWLITCKVFPLNPITLRKIPLEITLTSELFQNVVSLTTLGSIYK